MSDTHDPVGKMIEASEGPRPVPDTALWCVHIIGPDDVIAFPDRASAEREASILNEASRRSAKKHADDAVWPRWSAEVIPWPHSAESHAADLARNIKQMDYRGNA